VTKGRVFIILTLILAVPALLEVPAESHTMFFLSIQIVLDSG